MNTAEEHAVLTDYHRNRERYEKANQELRRLFDRDIDPAVPDGAIYTITHRLKREQRLLEKVSAKLDGDASLAAEKYIDYIDDLLGMRIICLRLGDVDRVETFIKNLERESKLSIIRGPERKQTFLIRTDPRATLPMDLDLQYTGYSSVHYVVSLGSSVGVPEHLRLLKAELQVRTILEDAWGEIDHAYRYERVRSDVPVPDHIERGFYTFAAYLQAAALHSEYLCQEIERFEAQSVPEQDAAQIDPQELERLLERRLGFKISRRAMVYLERRVQSGRFKETTWSVFTASILDEEAVAIFSAIYEEISGQLPFRLSTERDTDAINCVIFAFRRFFDGSDVAEAGLRSALIGRFKGREVRLVLQAHEGIETEFTLQLTRLPAVGSDFEAMGRRWRILRYVGSGTSGMLEMVCERIGEVASE